MFAVCLLKSRQSARPRGEAVHLSMAVLVGGSEILLPAFMGVITTGFLSLLTSQLCQHFPNVRNPLTAAETYLGQEVEGPRRLELRVVIPTCRILSLEADAQSAHDLRLEGGVQGQLSLSTAREGPREWQRNGRLTPLGAQVMVLGKFLAPLGLLQLLFWMITNVALNFW